MTGYSLRTATLAALLLAGVPLATAAAAGPSPAFAPSPGSAQRRAILDALRPAIEAQIGPDVEFVVRQIRVVGGWALVIADPQRRGGGAIDGHHYFADFDNMGGLMVTALLRQRSGRWTLVEQAIGATDVWYCGRGPRGLTPSCSPN